MDDDTVLAALMQLKEQRLARFVLPSHGRSVTRYRHVADEVYAIDTPALALLAVLLLRGPQTPGELRTRTERMAPLATVDEVQNELERLAVHPDGLARLLPDDPAKKRIAGSNCWPSPGRTAPSPAGMGGHPSRWPTG